jgi:hypothetical protein
MFRLKKEKTTSKTFRMPIELTERLEKLAGEKELSLSKVVIQCCEYALQNLGEK